MLDNISFEVSFGAVFLISGYWIINSLVVVELNTSICSIDSALEMPIFLNPFKLHSESVMTQSLKSQAGLKKVFKLNELYDFVFITDHVELLGWFSAVQ